MYQCIAGIDTLESGYRKSKNAPKPSDRLHYTEASLETMYGKIVAKWEVIDKKITLIIEVPHNTSSVITLPNVQNEELVKKEICTNYPEMDIEFKSSCDSSLSLEVGSGTYTFVYDYKK